MGPDSKLPALLIEMLGSAAICAMVLCTDMLLGARRRRSAGL